MIFIVNIYACVHLLLLLSHIKIQNRLKLSNNDYPRCLGCGF